MPSRPIIDAALAMLDARRLPTFPQATPWHRWRMSPDTRRIILDEVDPASADQVTPGLVDVPLQMFGYPVTLDVSLAQGVVRLDLIYGRGPVTDIGGHRVQNRLDTTWADDVACKTAIVWCLSHDRPLNECRPTP